MPFIQFVARRGYALPPERAEFVRRHSDLIAWNPMAAAHLAVEQGIWEKPASYRDLSLLLSNARRRMINTNASWNVTASMDKALRMLRKQGYLVRKKRYWTAPEMEPSPNPFAPRRNWKHPWRVRHVTIEGLVERGLVRIEGDHALLVDDPEG